MALLLGARGRLGSRKGGGFLSVVRGAFESLTGRSWRSEQRSQRGRSIPGWLAGVGVLAAFAGGFLAGGHFGGPSNPSAGGSGLHAHGSQQAGTQQQVGGQNGSAAPTGTQPSVLDAGDMAKLSSHALAVCGYKQVADAKVMCATLRSRGLERARPYEVKQGNDSIWLVVVYYDGDSQRQETVQLLRSLTAADAAEALAERAKAENRGQAWPYEWAVK